MTSFNFQRVSLLGRNLGSFAAVFVTAATICSAQEKSPKEYTHGISLGAPLKYGPDLKFEWLNTNAPKGGKLVLGGAGTYDSLNPFAIKNDADSLISPGFRTNMVFQNLCFDSEGESFAKYGLLAESMHVAKDGMSISFKINPKAKFSDGKPVTTDDVAFSYKMLMSDKAPPAWRSYWADVKSVQVISKQEIKFDFKVKNRELPLILCELTIMPKHVYGTGKDFIKAYSKTKPIGSGPYVVESYDFGKRINYARDKNWWGKDEAFAKGQWNFDEIQVKYYKDPSASLEAFKAGDYDVKFENISRAWAVDHIGEKWDLGWIRKELWQNSRNAGTQGFFMNLRRPQFKDRQVRKALAIAFDFDWANETLFYKQYTQSSSFFNNSELAAKGLPDAAELALLNPLKDKLPPELFSEPKEPLGKGLTAKQRLGEAMKLFKEAGWEVKDGKLTNKTGEVFTITFIEGDGTWQRIIDPYIQSLAKIGVVANIKIEDQANYSKRLESHDFDITSIPQGQSDSPGNEQRDFWHSSSADKTESRNFSGVSNPAIDALVETLIKADTRDALVTATRALDRALWFNYILVPHWYMSADRVSIWSQIQLPPSRPSHYSQAGHFVFQTGWYDDKKADSLRNAMKTKSKI